MRLLLDTHVYLWAVANHPRLGLGIRAQIEQADEVYVSSASIWEIAIKVGLGKLVADTGQLVEAIDGSGFKSLLVTPQQAALVAGLPALHNDPFDRLLVAQALRESLTIVTADEIVPRYSVAALRVS